MSCRARSTTCRRYSDSSRAATGSGTANPASWASLPGSARSATRRAVAPEVQRHRAQPGTEAPVRVVGERRQLLDEGGEHFLGQVSRVLLLKAALASPEEEQGRIQGDESAPGFPVGA